MSFETIFTAKKEYLRDLESTEAEDFFRELLRAETLRLGPEKFIVNVPRGTNVKDGGIDATVDTDLLVTQSEIIAPGKNGYQIKSGKTIEPWQESWIKKELFGKREPHNQDNLGKSIKACLNVGGTYVLVFTGIYLSKTDAENTRLRIEKFLKQQCKYKNPKVKVWSQANLIEFLDEVPLLVLGLRGLLEAKFKPHWRWSKDDSMMRPFVHGESQCELIEQIKHQLRRDDCAAYVPVWGEPGVGKTRLVLEATKEDDLSPLVVYYRSDALFLQDNVVNELLQGNNHLSAIVVVDDCEPHNQIRIWDELKNQRPRIKLITISKDYDKIPEDVFECKVHGLNDEQISEIIQKYEVPKFQANRHSELCSGSPKMAHHVGKVLNHSSGDVSKILDQNTIFKSFYIDYEKEDLSSPGIQEKEMVLQHIALFKQFGFKNSVSHEANFIAEEIRDEITPKKFRKIILDLKKLGILKGEHTLHITPKALHIKLWTEWWEYNDVNRFNIQELITDDNLQQLRHWFNEMFKYAAESEDALKIVKQILGPNGPFQSDSSLNNLSSDSFLVLTEADPISALECLKQTVGKCESETLLQFTARRNVVWALEKIAIWRELFPDAARLLLALGEAENEEIANNASGVFADLFSLGPGPVAPTEAPPIERLPVLKEAFESGSKERRKLALNACNKGLQSGHFARFSGAENQGLRGEPNFWDPTYQERREAYRSLWQLLSEELEHLPEDECEEATGILLGHAGELGRIPNLGKMVVNTVKTITENKYLTEKQLLESLNLILFHDDSYVDNKGLPSEIRQSFEEIRDELIGSDFHSMMQRYVGMSLDIDLFDENDNYLEQGHPKIYDLAQQAINNPELLELELNWLVTTEAINGFAFGYQLGKQDNGFVLLSMLLDAQREAGNDGDASFLGGYFRSIFESDVTKWEMQLDTLVQDPKLDKLILLLTHCSGLTDKAGLRLLKLAKKSIINVIYFHNFVRGNVITNLSENVFTEWIQFMLGCSEELAVSVGLKLYYYYYIHNKQELNLPEELTFQLLSSPAPYATLSPNLLNPLTGHHWSEIGKAFLRIYPGKCLELVKQVLKHVGKDGTIFGGFRDETHSVLTEVTKQYPAEVWKHVSKYLETGHDFNETGHGFKCSIILEKWLKGKDSSDLTISDAKDGALTLIPQEQIWEWIDQDLENRAWYFAYRLVPKTFSVKKWQTSLARGVLVHYGEREDVRHSLYANYSSGAWKGELSSHLDQKKEKLLDIKDSDDDKNVQQWIKEYVAILEEKIENAKIDEERRL